MAPTISTIGSFLKSSPLAGRNDIASLGPLAARSVLLARDDDNSQNIPVGGVIDPHEINNKAIFALFGLIGAAFVCLGIWFFFWAKNGGFIFRKDDWDDYKSTVLRRRGPNGTLLSGATPSTILGGGSIYKDVDDGSTEQDNTTIVSGTTGITGITAGVSDIDAREKRRKKREQKEREMERRREEKSREKSRRKVGADGALIDEDAEAEAKAHLRKYRHEKAARVGGINKQSEGSSWDGSTNPSYSSASGSGVGHSEVTGSTVTSELISHRERTPTSTPTKKQRETDREGSPKKHRETGDERPSAPRAAASGGIRKVYSTADKNATRENERIRTEARKLQEKGRAAARERRDFSFQRADETMSLRRIDEQEAKSSTVVSGDTYTAASESRANEPRVPGSWAESVSDLGTSSEVGTKVYRHPVHIPVASSSAGTPSEMSYAEEKRKKRGGAGYRRHRGGDSESGV
ncbi:hypothetical protein B0H66DRAFT_548170 [Apodospora peruviana]|uniref:Endosomal spry domain-containing protein n=1 Tax=Apodospora peruviana TaxID=516989 RepID=A0AAE0MAI0_9PEZI|nr:hypothetical protein B0H66DRAFT_548170 [Apodospora peruviana]